MLISCHECGSPVSSEAAACMSCGAPPQTRESGHEKLQKPLVTPSGNTRRKTRTKSKNTEASGKKEVNFINAKYFVSCPTCNNNSVITGSKLIEQNTFSCSIRECKGRLKISDRAPELINDQVIVSRRVRDIFSLKGRISVEGYWLSVLILLPLIIFASALDAIVGSEGIIAKSICYFLFWPLRVKRMHDLGFDGMLEWCFLLGNLLVLGLISLIPSNAEAAKGIVGFVILIELGLFFFGAYLALFEGQKKVNRYGPNPRKIRYRFW